MKLFIIFFLIWTPFFSVFCEETILFIDTNNNPKEIETAKASAKKLGKKFIIYPQNGKKIVEKDVTELLQKTNFSTLILSGHNGGGDFSGKSGSIGIMQITEALKNNQAAKNNVRSLLLLGCNTGNKGQVIKWKTIFPELNIIAGYDGTAPAGYSKYGHNYIREALENNEKLLQTTDSEKLEKLVKNFDGIFNLEAGLYFRNIECHDGKNNHYKEYYFSPISSERDAKVFEEINFQDCPKHLKKFQENVFPVYTKYFYGEKKPDNIENVEEMKKIYNFLHQISYCMEDYSVELIDNHDPESSSSIYKNIDWRDALHLRFWEDSHRSFVEYYEEDLKKHFKFINKLKDPIEFKRLVDKKKATVEDTLHTFEKYQDNVDLYLKDLKELLNKNKILNKPLEEEKERLNKLSKDSKRRAVRIVSAGEIESLQPTFAQFDNDEIDKDELKRLLTAKLGGVKAEALYKEFIIINDINNKMNKIFLHMDTLDIWGLEEKIQAIKQNKEKAKQSLNDYKMQLEDRLQKINELNIEEFINRNFLSKELTTEDFSKMDRRQITNLAHDFNRFQNEYSVYLPEDELVYLNTIDSEFISAPSSLNGAYYAFSWHEYTPNPTPPNYSSGEYEIDNFKLTNDMEKAYQTPASKLLAIGKQIYIYN